ncbi:MAG: AAA family ATPase [Salinarimonas sp.]
MRDDDPVYSDLEPGGIPDYDHPEPRNGSALTGAAIPYPLRLLRDLDEEVTKEWLVHGMLGTGELSDVYGAPGSGKSVVIGDLAYHVAAGIDWHGRRVMQSAVLYVAAERRELVERRFVALRKTLGHADAPLGVIGGTFALAHDGDDKDRIIATALELGERAGLPCRLIILDTKNRVMAGRDENSAKDTSQLVANIDDIQNATGAHVTLIDHMPHEATRMRGHGALLGACDCTFRITKAGEFRTLEIDKVNDGPDDVKFTYRLRSVQIGYDHEAGEATTAPVVEAAQGEAPKAHKPLPARYRQALDALREAIGEHGKEPPEAMQLAKDVKAVEIDKWRAEILARGIIDREAKNPRTDFSRIKTALKDRTIISERNGLVWLV